MKTNKYLFCVFASSRLKYHFLNSLFKAIFLTFKVVFKSHKAMKMNPNIITEPIASNVWSIGRTIFIELTDGRTISLPADRFKILTKATDIQLKEVTIRLNGVALRWENLDEDITVKGILAGNFQLPLPE